jgi:nucleoside-diphosphate-sugar epimerase
MRDDAEVLVTGAEGCIGRILRRDLSDRYRLRLVDRRVTSPGSRVQRADLRNARTALRCCAGVDTVIDLAAISDQHAAWKDVYRTNLRISLNMLEAARRAGARRVIVASSNHVTGLYERDAPYEAIVSGRYSEVERASLARIDRGWPIRPDGFYGIGKAAGEAAGRYFAEAFGLSVICLRIGTVNPANRPTSARTFATLLTHRDLVQLIERCIEAPPSIRYAIYYGVSDNAWRFWEIQDARREIGYEPQDDAEAWR